jgi:hypothetical protein
MSGVGRNFGFGLLLALMLSAISAVAQPPPSPAVTNAPPPGVKATNDFSLDVRAEKIRGECIEGRRYVCGRVMQILTNGLVVESGYTELLSPPLNQSWVARQTVSLKLDPKVVETTAPDSPCVGTVFLTDIPKRPKVERYDYVVIHGYPAGQITYSPVPGITKTVRRFSAGLETAVALNLRTAATNPPASPPKK